MTLLVEFSIIVKFGIRLFDAPFPDYVKLIWTLIGIFVLIGGLYAYCNERKSNAEKINNDS